MMGICGLSEIRRASAGCAFLALGLLIALPVAIKPACAQDFPTKAISWVVPNGAGSTTDVLSRLITEKLGPRLGQPVIVLNKPGANNMIAAVQVARSPADGHTLLVSSNTAHASNPALFTKVEYDPIKDFTPIIRMARVPFVLLVHPSMPVRTTPELIQYLKANPGKVSYGFPGSTSQVAAAMLTSKAGLEMTPVPYGSSPQALNDLVAGHIQVYMCDMVSAMPMITAGKVRALGVTIPERSRFLPDTPSLRDNVPGFPDISAWLGIFAPASTPQPVADRLAREITAILNEADIKSAIDKVGFEVYLTRDRSEFAAFVADQVKLWGEMIAEAKIPKTQN